MTGDRTTRHWWGLPGPAAGEGTDGLRLAALRATLTLLEERARTFEPIAERLAPRR